MLRKSYQNFEVKKIRMLNEAFTMCKYEKAEDLYNIRSSHFTLAITVSSSMLDVHVCNHVYHTSGFLLRVLYPAILTGCLSKNYHLFH